MGGASTGGPQKVAGVVEGSVDGVSRTSTYP